MRIKPALIYILLILLLAGCSPRDIDQSSQSSSQTASQPEESGSQPESLPPESEAPSSMPESSSTPQSSSTSSAPTINTKDWRLILVSAAHPLQEEHQTTLQAVGQIQVDKRIAPALEQMIAAAKKDGHTLLPISGHRTFARSKYLYEREVAAYKQQGFSEQEAAVEAGRWVAPPGTSEHNTGLAVDIISGDYYTKLPDLSPKFADFPEAKWMAENAHRFGFILRYPKDKETVTGIGFEPWHFRYVGEEAAAAIYQAGITLEEYLDV